MIVLHLDVLTPEGKILFSRLAVFKDYFYLAGGTALALQIGHRVSVDFDLFSPDPIKKTLIAKVEKELTSGLVEPLVATSRELTVIANGVKCTFLHYPFEILLPLETGGPVDLLSAKEILATKAYTIGRRGSFKDYIDLFVGVRSDIASLEEIIDLASRKYGSAFNDRLFLEQLLYIDDVPEESILMRGKEPPQRKDITDFFSTKIQTLSF